ncbi:MAG: hypothetical protein EZS28_039321, partial [Streblomastix strix]
MKKDIETMNEQQNDQQLGYQYEEIEYEEEEEVEQEIEQEIEQKELVPIAQISPIQDQNEKEIVQDKDKEEDILGDLEIPPRNCVSPSLVNQFLPPIKPVLWARLLKDWEIDWKIQVQQDYPLSQDYIPHLKQDSGSKYYIVKQEPDKIQEQIDELNNKKIPTSSKKEMKEKQQIENISALPLIQHTQPDIGTNENVQQQEEQQEIQQQDENQQEEEPLLDPEVIQMRLKREIIPSYPQFEEMRRKLAEQSNFLQGFSAKGRQLRKKSGYQLLGLAVDDAEQNSIPLAPQMLPRNHPFLKNGPPQKWLQKQIKKKIYSKSQIADIKATRELKSIFDTPWFQEYTEEIEKRNYRNVAKLQWPGFNISETQISDQTINLPELTEQEKKSTLRFGYVDSGSDYAADQDEAQKEQEKEYQQQEEQYEDKHEYANEGQKEEEQQQDDEEEDNNEEQQQDDEEEDNNEEEEQDDDEEEED